MHKMVPQWVYGSAAIATAVAAATARTVMKRKALPPLERIVLMWCENYWSFMSIERPNTKAMFEEHASLISAQVPNRKQLSVMVKDYSSHMLDRLLHKIAASNHCALPVPVMLSVDVASTRGAQRCFVRYFGVALAARGFPPVMLCLLTDDAVVRSALAAVNADVENVDDDEIDEDALAEAPDEQVHLSADVCRAKLNALIAHVETKKLRVVAVTTDNGSNMKKMADEQDGIFSVRCACHCFQLIAKAVLADPVHKADYDACVAFKTRCMADNAASRAVRHVWPLLEKTTTRWNGELKFLRAGVEVFNKYAAPLTGVDKPHTSVIRRLEETLLPALTRLESATLICEGNRADMLSVIEALAVIDFAKLPVDPGTRDSLQTTHVGEKMVTPALVFTAFFCAGYAQREVDHFVGVRSMIKTWLQSKQVFLKLAQCAGVSQNVVVAEFDKYCKLNHPARDSFSRKDFEQHIEEIEDEGTPLRYMPALAAIVKAVASTLPSEANLESLFSRLGVFLPQRRANVLPTTLEAQLIVNVAASCDAAIDEALREDVVMVAEDAAADAAPGAAAVALPAQAPIGEDAPDAALGKRMAKMVIYILKRAATRYTEWRTQQRNEDKCKACGTLLTNKTKHRSADVVECTNCHRKAGADCLNIVGADGTYICETGLTSPTSSWW